MASKAAILIRGSRVDGAVLLESGLELFKVLNFIFDDRPDKGKKSQFPSSFHQHNLHTEHQQYITDQNTLLPQHHSHRSTGQNSLLPSPSTTHRSTDQSSLLSSPITHHRSTETLIRVPSFPHPAPLIEALTRVPSCPPQHHS